MSISLGSGPLSVCDLNAVGRGASVSLDETALGRMADARHVLEQKIQAGSDIYGATTGLGPRSVERLDSNALDDFALQTIRGRAHAMGDPLPEPFVRAAMAVRIQTLLSGASGARPDLATHLAGMLNAGLIPMVRDVGSVGAADLIWGATLGLGVIGEGSLGPAEFEAAGMAPYEPATREGLALASHSGFVAAIGGLALGRLTALFTACEAHAALALEGFQANLSPLNPDVVALRPQALEIEAARRLRALLKGSPLMQPGAARRLQDPLSLRNLPQVHGGFLAALDSATEAALVEINHPSDNPAVLLERGEVLSNGSFLSIHLQLTLSALAQATTALASMIFARISRMLAGRFTGLSDGLAVEGAGLGPLLKPAEALFAEIAHLATPPVIHPSPSADGLEDQVSHAAIPAKALHKIIDHLARLSAIEAVVASQAIDIREIIPPANLRETYGRLRDQVAFTPNDRPLGEEIEALAQTLLSLGIKEQN